MLNTTFAYQQKAGVNIWENVAFTMFDIYLLLSIYTFATCLQEANLCKSIFSSHVLENKNLFQILGYTGSNQGCLPFTQNHPCEILCINIKLLNLTRWENELLLSISKSAEQTQKSRKIASPQITAHIFWNFPDQMARTIWSSNPEIPVFHVNGKYPRFLVAGFYCTLHGATHGGDAIKNLCRPSVQSDLICTILVISRKPNPTIKLFYLIFFQNNLEVPFFICLLLGKLRV